jgi:hypothetical protein
MGGRVEVIDWWWLVKVFDVGNDGWWWLVYVANSAAHLFYKKTVWSD